MIIPTLIICVSSYKAMALNTKGCCVVFTICLLIGCRTLFKQTVKTDQPHSVASDPRLLLLCIICVICVLCLSFASVYCCLVVTCWERADILALVRDVLL